MNYITANEALKLLSQGWRHTSSIYEGAIANQPLEHCEICDKDCLLGTHFDYKITKDGKSYTIPFCNDCMINLQGTDWIMLSAKLQDIHLLELFGYQICTTTGETK